MVSGIISMNYNSKTLLDVKFTKNVKGYDALEVDKALDKVIEDLIQYEKKTEQDKKTIDELTIEINKLKEQARKDEIELKRLKNIVDAIPDSPDVNRSNIAYLKRISDLEKALYKKGVDPKKI